MNTFDEYQASVTGIPLSLRNNRDRVDFPVLGLQEEAAKIGSLLASAFASGQLKLTTAQAEELRRRMADVLWCVATLCGETGVAMQEVAALSVTQVQERAKGLDPEQR